MDQQGYQGHQSLQPPQLGPGGRKLHIAHRRSPSELTPLMMEQLAIQQQIDVLQQQQQQIAATHQQYVNMGMIPPQQQLNPGNAFPGMQPNMSPQPNAFQFPQQMQPQQMMSMGPPPQPSAHRRNQSALPQMNIPQIGPVQSAYADFNTPQQGQSRENTNPRSRGGGSQGHARRHSLALPEAKKAAELAEQKRKTAGFQFPLPGATATPTPAAGQPTSPSGSDNGQPPSTSLSARGRGSGHGRSQSVAVGSGRGSGAGRGTTPTFSFPQSSGPGETSGHGQGGDFQRRGSGGHNRSASRNFEGNWRQQQNTQQAPQDQPQNPMGSFAMNQNANLQPFQPGHRARASMNQSINSIGNFQYPGQPQLIQLPQGQVLLPQQRMYAGAQGLNQLQMAQLQALQVAQSGQAMPGLPGMPGLQGSQHAPQGQLSAQQQQQAQRKTLFTPYLPQANLPALLSDGQLVAGVLRVNKKNRSDAYVTATELDADIFICGSKDRNRALEGDLVAVELLDVDDVWGQKREKEEKKKRKDVSDTRSNTTNANDATTGGDNSTAEGGIRRRGSLRQRPTQKKNDDVEVEGQSLLLMEEEEINDEQKPLYAGHIVAVIERVAGQMFSGTLGLLRPSSQATKEKQEAERQAREGSGKHQPDKHNDKPKIVWFKPTDKRVPLIAIPTEQAPRNFVEKHQDYANCIFVACIKRWPITSLHPFGTLVEQLGEMGDLKVETDALLRDNNFGPDDFSDAVLKSVGFEDWTIANDDEKARESRRDFCDDMTFTIDPNGSNELDDALHLKTLEDGHVEIGVHVADVAYFVKANSLVDREAKKRGTAVYLMNRTVNMLPPRISTELCSLSPGQDRYTVSIVFKVDPNTGLVSENDTWVGKGIIRSSGKLSYEEVDAVIGNQTVGGLSPEQATAIKSLYSITNKFRQARFGGELDEIPPLRLLYQLDDENVPVEHNIFNSSPAHELVEELANKTNAVVAQRVYQHLGDRAWLRRQPPPNPRRLQTFAERMTNIGYDVDTSSSGSLQNSLFKVEDSDYRKGMETLLIKSMQRAKYTIAGKHAPEELGHFALNLPLYTHFTNPSRRYADIVVHRQLEAALSDGSVEFNEDLESLQKTAESCNTKKDSAHSAQEQSVHIESCRKIDKRRTELGGNLVCDGIVLCVYESAFDVLIPEYGFEKRVHCDQLPLKKAEFDKNKRILELYWEKGVPSSAYIPEDERPKIGSVRGANAAVAAKEAESRRSEELRRRQVEAGTISTDDTDALFDDDDDVSDLADATAGVSLSQPNGSAFAAAPSSTAADTPEAKLTDKDKYRKFFSLREVNGDYIQDVREMTRVPVILTTDLTKSPPCLTIRSLNPYAL